MNDKVFYNAHGILTYKRLYNIVMGVRGHGKTDNLTRRPIETGLQTKKISCVILVRYKEDIRNIKDSWWQVCSDRCFPEWQFFSKNRIIYAKNEMECFPIAEIVALSEYTRAKKVPRPYVKWIIFDEFLNEDMDYLNNEVDKFLSVCDSIIRNREDVKVFLISNTISMINPYFDYFGIKTIPNQRFTKCDHDCVLEFTDSADFVEYRKQTKFGASVDNTNYGQFALEGKFMLDDTTNVIKEFPKGKNYQLFNLVLDGINICVNFINNLYYFSFSKDFSRLLYTPYVNDAKQFGAIFCGKNFRYFKQIMKAFMNDEVMYQDIRIKNAVIEFVRYLMGNRYR